MQVTLTPYSNVRTFLVKQVNAIQWTAFRLSWGKIQRTDKILYFCLWSVTYLDSTVHMVNPRVRIGIRIRIRISVKFRVGLCLCTAHLRFIRYVSFPKNIRFGPFILLTLSYIHHYLEQAVQYLLFDPIKYLKCEVQQKVNLTLIK